MLLLDASGCCCRAVSNGLPARPPTCPPRFAPTLHPALQQHAEARGWQPPLLVALAFRAQMVEEVPVQPHDVGVDAIITADEVIACSPAGVAALGSSSSGGGSGAT